MQSCHMQSFIYTNSQRQVLCKAPFCQRNRLSTSKVVAQTSISLHLFSTQNSSEGNNLFIDNKSRSAHDSISCNLRKICNMVKICFEPSLSKADLVLASSALHRAHPGPNTLTDRTARFESLRTQFSCS